MSEWKKVKFLDLFSEPTKNGIYKSKDFHGKGAKIINMGEVFAYSFIGNQEMSRVEINDKERNSFLVKDGDLLFARRSLVESGAGKCAIANGITEETIFESSIIRVRLNENYAIPLFYMYWMRSLSGRTAINGIVNGVNVKGIRATDLQNIEVDLPPFHTQHRIATILSRYDSLIENYQKQIKLLEESAQRLYKEWFVDLHFPGNENTKIVDGVPEGWVKKPVDSIYSIKYGKNLSTKLITESGEFPVYGANGVIGYYDKANCNEQVVLITSRGNGSGDVLMTYHKDAFITNNSFIVLPLEDYSCCQLPFTYQFLKNANFRAVRTGAAQPQLTNQSIHTVDVVLPSKGIIIDYCEKVSFSNKKIIILRNQIRLLTEARDRLLPKLMSGEIVLEGETA